MDWLIVGLGNPGPSYEEQRHNIGSAVVKALQKSWDFPDFRLKGGVALSTGIVEHLHISLVLPIAYMNLSGQALGPLLRFYKISCQKVIIIHDELDLPAGVLRFKKGGGAAGHRGLLDIEAHVGRDTNRFRIGIGHPGRKEAVSTYVLSPFDAKEQISMAQVQQKIIDALPSFLLDREQDFLKKMATAP